MAIAGKGGMPTNPGQYLRGETVWQDLRIPQVRQNRDVSAYTDRIPLLEAQTWQFNQSGKVELVAKTSIARSPWL